MSADVFAKIYRLVWQEIMADLPEPSFSNFKKHFTSDLNLPIPQIPVDQQKEIYVAPEYDYHRLISKNGVIERLEKDGFMQSSNQIHSLADVIDNIAPIASFRAERNLNSEFVINSDDVHSSSYVYNSTHIYNCHKTIFSYNTLQSEFILASKGSKSCNFCIRVVDSTAIANSLDVSWSNRCNKCYFCHDVFDLEECMFCFHIASKKYCIANTQFSKDEYFKLKKLILNEYHAQLNSGFAYLSQIIK